MTRSGCRAGAAAPWTAAERCRGWRLSRAARLAVLALILGLGSGSLGCPGRGAAPGRAAGGDTARDLAPGARCERAMRPGETHRYGLRLAAGQFVRVTVDQRGIDVRLMLRPPLGAVAGAAGEAALTVADSPTGNFGPERVSVVAATTGRYRLDVVAASAPVNVTPGRYELRVAAWRPATPADRVAVAAEWAIDRGEELRRAREFDAALLQYQAALDAWTSIGSAAGQAEALYRLGWVRESMDQPRAAADLLRAAAAAFARLGMRSEEAVALNRMGRSLRLLGALDEAVAAHQQAQALSRGLRDRSGTVLALNNLCLDYQWLGKDQLALDACDAALALSTSDADAEQRMQTLFNLGRVLTDEEKLDEAAASYRDGLRIAARLDNPRALADGLSGEAGLLHRSGQTAAAVSRLERALAYRRQAHDKAGAAEDLLVLGVSYLEGGAQAPAADAFRRAQRLFRQLGNRNGEALALLDLGRASLDAGELAQSLSYHQQALPLFAATQDRKGVDSAEYGAAMALYRMGRLQEARRLLAPASAGLEQLRTETDVPSLRRSSFASRQRYWELYVEVLMRLGDRDPGARYDEEAFALVERRRARSLLDLVRTAAGSAAPATSGGEGGEEDAVVRALAAAGRLRLRLLDSGETTDVAAVQRLESALSGRLERLRARRGPRDLAAAAPAPPPLSASAAERLLGDDEALLEYSLGDESSYVWVVTRGSCRGVRLAGRARIEAAAQRVAHLAQRLGPRAPAAWEEAARALGDLVLAPIVGQLHHRRLLIAGDGALLSVPFAALPDPSAGEEVGAGAAPLVAGHELAAVPSASVLGALRRRAMSAGAPSARVAVLADPVFRTDDNRLQGAARVAAAAVHFEGPSDLRQTVRDLGLLGLARLPATRQEALAIERASPAGSLIALDFAASKRLVLAGALRRYGYLHFATHGLVDGKHPELSGIVLSLLDERGSPQDGFLRLDEIYGLDLPARLVVLSACETGLGESVAGEGLVGLSWGFLHAGAERVLVSLWKVSDESTAELMRRFYAALFAGRSSIPAALCQAQLAMRAEERWRSPYYWAGFVIQGD